MNKFRKLQFKSYLPILFVLFLFGFLSFSNSANAQVITEDTVWIASSTPYIINYELTIQNGATLTIEEGAVLKFYGQNSHISVYGTLNIQGTETNKVYLTSIKDDSIGGDTNGDGNATTPAPADRGVIIVYGELNMNNTDLHYGGYCTDNNICAGVISNMGGNINILNSKVRDNRFVGIYQKTGITDVSFSEIYNNVYGLFALGGSIDVSFSEIYNNQYGLFTVDGQAKINFSNIHDNIRLGVVNISQNTYMTDAKNNYWGSLSGPYHPTLNPQGLGDQVYGDVDFIPWLQSPDTAPESTLTYSEEQGYQDDQTSQGIEPNKGTASSTLFTFKAVYENQNNTAPQNMSVVIGNGISTSTYPMIKDAQATTTPQLYDNDYTNKEQYIATSTFAKGKYQYHFEASDGTNMIRLPETGELSFEAGYSNVAFLPGIQATRLYDTDGTMIWEPNNNTEALKIALNPDGTSKNPDIYVKEGEIIDEVTSVPAPQPNIYKSFIKNMDDFVNKDKIINEWKPIVYDWRLSFDDVVNKGYKQGDKIYYSYATSTPYIIQELKRLQQTSANGKVTIVTHSMGGLIAKSLIKKLEDENDDLIKNIDKLIIVAAPQLGTPKAMVSLLHGEETSFFKRPFINQQTKRYLAQNMQSAYNLLPSEKYFKIVDTDTQPIIEFDPNAALTQIFRDIYGNSITDAINTYDFLLGKENRIKPAFDDILNPEILDGTLLNNATSTHSNTFDYWLSPENIKVTQIAGWGDQKTIRGIKYTQKIELECSSVIIPICEFKTFLDPRPIFTQDGDGTVVVPSAVAMDGEKFYLDINSYNNNYIINRNHGDIFEIDSLFDFVKGKVADTFNNLFLPQYLSITKPPAKNPFYRLALRSPVSINIYDNYGNHTGLAYDQNTNTYYIEEQIPNSYYIEFGEGKYVGFDVNNTYQIELKGEDYGTFTFEVEEVLGDEVLNKTVFFNIPVSASTTATLNLQDLNTTPELAVDIDGDGTTDLMLTGEEADTQASFEILAGILNAMNIHKGLKKELIKKIEKAIKELKKRKTDKVVKKLNNIIKKLEKEIKKNTKRVEKEEEKENHKDKDDGEDENKKDKQKISTEDAWMLISIIEGVKLRML